MRVTRRPARGADTEFARRVHHAAYREVCEAQFGPWDEAAQDRFFEGDWRDARFEIVLADGEPCGYLSVDDTGDSLYVREIVLDPGYQGRCIGSTLLREVLERARSRGVPVLLGTHLKNRAGELYRRLGFRETGRTDTHMLFRCDPAQAE
ncbi:MAG TPA: GNAT family N-acetyltransferase [Chloroflexota bacterium]|nr:GNAT family N-acetyltransferase [Chloroflexota bacterium]